MKKEMSIYDFCCKKARKISLRELFQWLELEFEPDSSVVDLGDRYLRINNYGLIQFSDLKKDFDRWANSTSEMSFDLKRRSEWRLFVREIEKIKVKSG